MTDIFAEVDEAIKQERLEKIWADYKIYIIGTIVGIIVLTGIVSAYHSWRDSVAEEQTAALGILLEAEDFPANVNLENLSLSGDVRAMALMSAGAALVNAQEPDLEKAAAYYKAVAVDGKVSDRFQGLASLMLARISGDGDDAAAREVLEQVYNDEKSLWRYHAAVELAVLAAHGDDADYAKARDYLNTVDEGVLVPAGLKMRARSLAHVYTLRERQAQ